MASARLASVMTREIARSRDRECADHRAHRQDRLIFVLVAEHARCRCGEILDVRLHHRAAACVGAADVGMAHRPVPR
jgi:hypothetical protein